MQQEDQQERREQTYDERKVKPANQGEIWMPGVALIDLPFERQNPDAMFPWCEQPPIARPGALLVHRDLQF
ncbi:hypothetical protein GC169_13710 [bacterium]|nr:hypothetical protein [bacterium]